MARDIPSAGTILQIKLEGVYTDIPLCTDINWEGYERAVRSPTHLLSDAVPKKPGMPNFGQITATVWYDPADATHKALRDRNLLTAAEYSANLDSFKIIYADGYDTPAEVEISGFVSQFSQQFTDPETGTAQCSLTVQVNDVIDFTDGTD